MAATLIMTRMKILRGFLFSLISTRILAISLIFIPFFFTELEGAEPLAKRIEGELEGWLKQERLPGLAAAAVFPLCPNGQIWTMGKMERGGREAILPHTSFNIGRVSETISGSILFQGLKEKGLSLDTPLSTFLPRNHSLPKYRGKEISFRHLLLHQSAFPSVLPTSFHPSQATSQGILNLVQKMRLKGEPGAFQSDTLLDYPMAALMFERLSHVRFFPYLEGKLKALGMKETGLHRRENSRAFFAAARGIHSCIADLKVWLCHQLKSPPELSKGVTSFGEKEIAMGWIVEKMEDHLLFFRGDRYLGKSIFCAFIPAAGVGFALMVPEDRDLTVLGKTFLHILLKEGVPGSGGIKK